MDSTTSFGYWVRRRRKALDLTQRALADRVGCSVVTVKKIEADERQPSRQLAERFAAILAVPPEERAAFLARARGLLASDQLSTAGIPGITPVAPGLAPLPAEQTPFIGRAAELQQLAQLLADPHCRLLTLVGPGGIGKTRLMLRAAASARFAHGVCFVPLADIAAAQAAPTIAASLGLHHIGGQDTEQAIVAFLSGRELLLILDNVEHLLASEQPAPGVLPGLVSRILGECPRVKLLVTSREQLNLQAEWLFPVTGIAPGEDARALFVARAQRVRPSFAAGQQEAIIDDICRRVEGMPLAIELAASWVAFFSCAQILRRLSEDNELLAARSRDAPGRHRSLRASLDQSWDLLTDDERRLFAGLSVFRGGFAAEDAGTVCDARLETLVALVEKSLVAADGAGRYRLHEVTRRYAAEQLAASGAAGELQEKHCRAYLALAEAAASHFAGPSALHWFGRLDQEQDNVRAALAWALGQADVNVLYRLARPLARYWYAQGRWQEGVTWLRALLARAADSVAPARAEALCWCGIMLARGGHEAEAVHYFHEGYALAQRTEDAVALGLASLAMAAIDRDGRAHMRHYDVATEQFRRVHNDELVAMTLYFLGDELRMQSAIPAARAAYLESLRLYRDMGNLMYLAYPLGNLGRLALHEGDIAAAQRDFAECVAYSRRNGNGISLADWLICLGTTAVYRGDAPAAREALQEAYALANDLAYQAIIPHVQAWMALAEGVAGNHRRALEYLRHSLEGYSSGLAGADGSPFLIGPDVLDALVAAAYLHAALAQHERAAVVLSGVEQLSQTRGYHLDQPLGAIVDAVRSACDEALNPTRIEALLQQGRAMRVDELLGLAAATGPLA
jgi:predicted ATPase/DNA-binding XRE family transcriptional regulator